jgi:hypothetical protein
VFENVIRCWTLFAQTSSQQPARPAAGPVTSTQFLRPAAWAGAAAGRTRASAATAIAARRTRVVVRRRFVIIVVCSFVIRR